MYHYRAKVLELIDGDTLAIEIDLGFRTRIDRTVRVFGFNAPEIRGPERERGLAAKAYAIQQVPVGSFVEVRSFKPDGGDKYGRYLANVTLEDGRDFALMMVQAGHVGGQRGELSDECV